MKCGVFAIGTVSVTRTFLKRSQSEATSEAQGAEPIPHSYSSNDCEWLVFMNEKLKVKNEKW